LPKSTQLSKQKRIVNRYARLQTVVSVRYHSSQGRAYVHGTGDHHNR